MAVTWNPLDKGSAVTLSNGNLTMYAPGYTDGSVRANTEISSGKKYWEITPISGSYWMIGVGNATADLTTWNLVPGQAVAYSVNGTTYPGGVTYGANYTINDIIGVALDMDTGTLGFYKNGVYQGMAFTDIKTNLGATIYPLQSYGSSDSYSVTANFGATPFAYPIPTGYTALDFTAPTAIDITITATKCNATSQAINPTITVSSNYNAIINSVVATAIIEAKNPTIATESILNATIQAIRSNCTSKFINPLISVIKDEIAQINILDFTRKPIIQSSTANNILNQFTRKLRTEVI